MKGKYLITIVLVVAILSISFTVLAFSNYDSTDEFLIKENQIMKKDLITFLDRAVNKGVIVGDLITISNGIYNYGVIKGDILSICDESFIDGNIKGDVRTWSNKINIIGEINKNITVITRKLEVEEDGIVDGSITVIGDKVVINGLVGSDIRGYVDVLVINGEVRGDINIEAKDIMIGQQGKIHGNVRYKSIEEISFNKKNTYGDIRFDKRVWHLSFKQIGRLIRIIKTILKLSFKLGIYIIGIIMVICFSTKVDKITQYKKEDFQKIFILGVLTFIGVPIISLIFMITILGFPFGLIFFSFYMILVYLSKIPCAIWLGKKLLREKFNNIICAILGLLIIDIIYILPIIGALSKVFLTVYGLGFYIYLVKYTKIIKD